MMQIRQLINGQLVSGAGNLIPVMNPSTGGELIAIAEASPEQVLAAVRPTVKARNGRLVCVFGCGGERDPGKRPLMGEVASRLADSVVLTSDNPRSENPGEILREISVAAPAAEVIEDRAAAIRRTILQAAASDVVLLAGKGHEPYQEIAGVRRPFSDIDEARAALAARVEEQQ